jgi:hypothetical protein
MPICVVTQTNASAGGKVEVGDRGIIVFPLSNQTPGTHRINITAGNQNTAWT